MVKFARFSLFSSQIFFTEKTLSNSLYSAGKSLTKNVLNYGVSEKFRLQKCQKYLICILTSRFVSVISLQIMTWMTQLLHCCQD